LVGFGALAGRGVVARMFRNPRRTRAGVAYSTFAGALTDFRRAKNDRWHLEQDDAASPQFAAVRDDSPNRAV
jgi:hypothetical protein